MKELKKLLPYFFRYKYKLILGTLFLSLSNYFRVLQPKAIREAMDLVVEKIKAPLPGVSSQDTIKEISPDLLKFGGTVLLLAILMGLFMYFMRQTIIVMSRLMEYDQRKDIFKHYQHLDTSFFKKNNTGDLMSRITEDVSKVRMAIGPAIMYGLNLVVLFTMTIISMLAVSPKLTLYSLMPLPILSLSIYYISDMINKRSSLIQQQLATINSIAQESYSGIRLIKSYTQEASTTQAFLKECENYRSKSMSLAKVDSFFFPMMLFLIGLSTAVTVYVGGLEVAAGRLTPGNIAEFVIYVNTLTWPVTSIGWVVSLVQQASASQKRINEFLDTQPIITNSVSKSNLTQLSGNISFNHVNFTYPETGVHALKDFSLSVSSHQKVLILGKTGSGKSTIAELILRMYDISSGSLTIDNKEISEIDLDLLRSSIGYVPQDVFLFSDTVSNNISLGRNDFDSDLIKKVAEDAAIHEEISSLSNGYETIVGERGVMLSGGQKQRISIARALIRKPKILILDDCLSAVDTKTERQISEKLQAYWNDMTTLIISHRLFQSIQFDQIIVLEEGKIVEKGTHEELLKNKGYYSQLFENQSHELVEV